MTSRALVTGGAGFIGSHVADHLLAEGFDVVIIDNLSSGNRDNVPPAAEFHAMDIGSPEAARLIRDGGFDAIFHLAAQIDVRKSVNDPAADAMTNVVGSLNLLEAVRASGRHTRFVFSSTGGAIYGDFVAVPSVEDFPKDPESPYGIAKLSVECYLAYYGRVHGVDGVVLRYANVYGPRQNPHGEAGVVAIFCDRILRGEPLTVFGNGRQTRDYVFVGDVARANVAAVRASLSAPRQLDTRAYNIGTATETTVLDLAESLQRAAGTTLPIHLAPTRPGEQARSCVTIDKAGRDLGWRPAMRLDDGLRETFAHFAARGASEVS